MKTTDIIIFAGQSNMQGQSECLSENEIVENAYEYKLIDNELTLLKNPVGENITYEKEHGFEFSKNTNQNTWLENHVTGSSCYGHTNLVPEFVRAYIGDTMQKTVVVHIAKGSTQISDWMPSAPGYEIIKEKSLAAIRKVREENYLPRKIFFVWLQGESDAIAGNSKSYYKARLIELSDALNKDLHIDKFCIIRVGRFTNDERDMEIINAQDEICNENEGFIMISKNAIELNKEPAYMNPLVSGHYSSEGLEKLGREAGLELKKFIENKI